MKDKKILYGSIVVASVILLYYMFKGESPIAIISGGGKKGETPKPTGFDPIALAKSDPNFKAQVVILQTKLNTYLKSKFPTYTQLVVDGYLGAKTTSAIEKVFGTELLPIKDKIQVKYFISQLN